MVRFEWFTWGMFFKGIRIIAAFGVLLGVVGCSPSSRESGLIPKPEAKSSDNSTAVPSLDLDKLPKQEPLVSIMITQGAFSGPVSALTGWVFYYVEPDPSYGSFLRGYRLVNGKIRETTLDSTYTTAEIMKAIQAIDFKPFDWAPEEAVARERLSKTLQEDEGVAIPATLDGAEYEIIINSKHGRFCMRMWNPMPLIDFYAPYSEKIDKLKRVIDTLAVQMGRKRLNLGFGL